MKKISVDQDLNSGMNEKEIDLSNFSSSKSKGAKLRSVLSGIMSIINSERFGKRITLSKKLMDELQWPEALQFAFNDNEIAVGDYLPENDHYFTVKVYGGKGVIYSSSLVQELTEVFLLDYSNKVSITLHKVKYVTIDDKKVAIITVS